MALFGSKTPPLNTAQPVARLGSLTAPGPTPNPLGTPTPPPGATTAASSSILAAQAVAARQKKLAAAGQPLIGGPTIGKPKVGSPSALLQPKTLLGF